ncbi:3-hydroxyacyl-CoA dehydrogenase/enoyl-CoA hydratase family protein [Arthrospiribacter ruber]|uniref:3-hydroxyacyl-CoA dehydrogenase/enoyl-CoA hydratase family protein n=1 Tax=Arthrospiribacter ruber TaxID=2487934 RepID=A0A951IUV5_9BACT|nr:3-hydroxyacyl-CoA dehydrogenase/enoyl-CoA hydratase family protein [Arthrospiribacter ruber]MBW3467413.1 3-hydroxyacyl-CoA dehydrogenase/enoyl-CoA hydratase family protein [Arthrospiribacter ruber]
MKRTIKKVAILGSGVMGSRIACHFANIGVEVLLLDIVPRELSEEEKKKGLSMDDKAVRNRIVNEAFQNTLKAKPASLYDKSYASRVSLGNFDDDLPKIKDFDWVIEVVVEKLEIKQSLFEKVEKHRKPGTLITSNTSGIPMHLMCEGRSEDFQVNFAGTHFFNPPRYLKLLEIIPGPKTDPGIVDFLMDYGDRFLGKETVLCKDTPAFIANRIGVYAIISGMHAIEKMGLGVSEVDKLTGTVIGRAKSATFRTMDVVGLDTTVNVANNLYKTLEHDESRDKFKLPKIVEKLYENKWWGDKTGQGYFKMIRHKDGTKELKEIDFETFEYKDAEKPKFKALEASKEIDDLKKRIKFLVNFDDKAGEFYRTTFYDLFKYCSHRIPEISDELYRIDQAVCAGFGWEYGPFENWDILGVKETVEKMEAAGEKVAPWVHEMLEAGHTSFYKVEAGQRMYYDIPSKSYKPIPGTEDFVILETLKAADKKLWSNAGSSIYYLGDDVLGLEFHTKMNSLGQEVIEGINTAIAMAEKSYKGLVIGNEGQNFSAGANLAMLFMFAGDQEFDEINLMIAGFQKTMMRARYSSVPVVVAPHNMALGGGCELSLHADAVQAHAELYMGLVEFGVGLIPAGGGTKEMTLRFSNESKEGDVELNRLQEYFMNIATAKVSTSAAEARGLGYLQVKDAVTLNRKRQLAEAKSKVLSLYDAGYSQPVEQTNIKVLGKTSLALFEAGITGMLYGKYISEHDAKIARKLAWVMSGGDLSSPTEVSEQYLLDLEREAFLSLTGEKKTLERIHSILFKGKPLRN